MCCLVFGSLKMLNGVTMKRMIPMMPLTLMCLANSTLRLRFSWIWRVTSKDDARSGEDLQFVLRGIKGWCAENAPGKSTATGAGRVGRGANLFLFPLDIRIT